MKSFDKFWGEFAIGLNADENEAQSIWEAGQQSKQAEMDELKKRIDESIEYINEVIPNDRQSVAGYQLGRLKDILKGENHES